MSHPEYTSLPPVFLFDMIDHGYAIGKSLEQHGIKIIGLFPSKRSFEFFSTIPYKKYVLPESNSEKIKLFINAAKQFVTKPVLIINNESYYPFIYQNIKELEQYFSFELPRETTLNQLLEKDLFNEFAIKNNIRIPVSVEISNHEPMN